MAQLFWQIPDILADFVKVYSLSEAKKLILFCHHSSSLPLGIMLMGLQCCVEQTRNLKMHAVSTLFLLFAAFRGSIH